MSDLWARFSAVAATNPYAWSPSAPTAEEISTTGPVQPHGVIPVPQADERQRPGRPGRGTHPVLGRCRRARRGCPRTGGSSPYRAPTRMTTGSSRTDRTCARRPPSASPGPGPVTGGGRDRRRGPRRPVLVLPLRRADRRRASSAWPSMTPAGPLTVTGGLGFAGGPGNNYVSHSIASMAERLRADPGAAGPRHGAGWYSTKHAVGLWSTTPPAAGFRHELPQDAVDALPQRAAGRGLRGRRHRRDLHRRARSRRENPSSAILALLTADERRTWGNVTDRDDMRGLMEEEGCGRKVRLASGRAGRAAMIAQHNRCDEEPSNGPLTTSHVAESKTDRSRGHARPSPYVSTRF